MKGKIFTRTLLLILSLSLILVGNVAAQDGPPEPVVYEGIEFPELPYPSRWIEINGSKIHYMETGDPGGTPILLLHGQPTWSYLWRNVMPHLEDSGRVIALDLIGMGLSDKPDIEYTYHDHREYIWGFIEAMELEDIVLVIHDWGSALGFDYAFNHQDNVQGIVFLEAVMAPIPSFGLVGDPEMAAFFETIRAGDGRGEAMLMGQNLFVEQFLPSMVVRELSEEEMNAYRAPYPTPDTRLPVFMWPNQIPVAGEPPAVHEVVAAYAEWLPQSELPKLQIHATPGAFPIQAVEQINDTFNNIETVNVGEGLHFIQEDQPDAMGEAIAEWLDRVVFAD